MTRQEEQAYSPLERPAELPPPLHYMVVGGFLLRDGLEIFWASHADDLRSGVSPVFSGIPPIGRRFCNRLNCQTIRLKG